MPDAVYVRDAFARIADRYVLTNHVLSCGADIWWRKVVTARIRKWKPARLLDVASGTGDLALEIQDQCPDCEVIATDFCAEMLAHAASRGSAKTMVADALNLPFPDGGFDVVTVAFGLRNMADYPAALREMQPRAQTRRPPADPRFLAARRHPPPPLPLLSAPRPAAHGRLAHRPARRLRIPRRLHRSLSLRHAP